MNQALINELEAIGHLVRFSPGEVIMSEGESGKGIYLMRSGSAHVSMASHDGRSIELRVLEPGSFIGLSSTLSCDHCCYTVKAAQESGFIFVAAEAAQEFLRTRPELCLQVIQLLGQEMSSLCNERSIINAGGKPVPIEASAPSVQQKL